MSLYDEGSFNVVKGRGSWRSGMRFGFDLDTLVLRCAVSMGGFVYGRGQRNSVVGVRRKVTF